MSMHEPTPPTDDGHLTVLRRLLTQLADPSRAHTMAAYMKGQFTFLGVQATPRRRAAAPWIRSFNTTSIDAILDVALALWNEPAREFQYVGTDLLRRYQGRLLPHHLPTLRTLVETKSWWDTVDALAAHPIGHCVRRHQLQDTMDLWARSDNLWVARTAVLHQLTYKTDTDVERLFRYCRALADHPDFFIRKAIGWALRELYKSEPEAMVAFVDQTHLSSLSRREALKHHSR